MHVRERVQDTDLSFLLEHEFAVVPFALLQGVKRAERGGGLGKSQMWMMSASAPLPSLWRAALGFLCLLCACLRVRIRNFSWAFAIVVFSDAFDAEASFSPGRFSATLFCCILCVYWDIIPRAC